MSERCHVCRSVLEPDMRDLGICRGCTDPERLEARISQLPDPIRSVMLKVGRDFGVVAGRDD